MQKVRIKEVKVEPGKTGDKEWKKITVTGEDGSQFTTFDHKAEELKSGDLIELEPVVKGKYVNFEKWNVLESGPPAAVSAPSNGNGMTPELWAEKDRLERLSIEGQVAMKCVTEAATHFVIDAEKDANLFNLWKQAMTVKLEAFIGAVKPQVKATPAEKKIESLAEGEEPTFKDNGQLMTYLWGHGVDTMMVCTALSISAPRDIKDPNKAYQDLKHLIKTPDEKLF